MCLTTDQVSHCSKESEIISLDAGLRLYGKSALDFMGFDRRSSSRKHVETRPNLQREKKFMERLMI